MITPTDHDLLVAMVGPKFTENIPQSFKDEYGVRLGMLSRAGVSAQGLGIFPLMQLLRDMKIEPEKKDQTFEVDDWRKVEVGRTIMYEGRRGKFVEISGDGMILIRLDGYRGNHEVPGRLVTLTKPKVQDVPDETFENDPDYEPTPQAQEFDRKNQPQDPQREADDSSRGEGSVDDGDDRGDVLFETWQHVPAGTAVEFTNDDDELDLAEYVDVEGKDSVILLYQGRNKVVPADRVKVPEKEPAQSS